MVIAEDLVVGADVDVLAGREPVLLHTEPGRALPEDRYSVGVLVRQRAQQKRVGDAEDRRVRTDPERERRDSHRREGRLRGEDAKSVTKVLPPRFHDSTGEWECNRSTIHARSDAEGNPVPQRRSDRSLASIEQFGEPIHAQPSSAVGRCLAFVVPQGGVGAMRHQQGRNVDRALLIVGREPHER